MLKRALAIVLVLTMAFSLTACDINLSKSKENQKQEEALPEYEQKQFELSGFWAPYELTEESFKQYKDVGFTHFAMINHSLSKTSENQFYLGSERTKKALELCRKTGLNAILNYNDWVATWSENDPDYNGDTPFSKYDLYGEYKDIITGIHIVDEPYLKRPDGSSHFETYGNTTLIEDFKKVYPNAEFIVNLIPFTAYATRGFDSYDQMMELVEETFMEPFDNPYVSVDVYPFHQGSTMDDGTLLINYQYIANSAKKYGIKPAYILQSSVGGTVKVQNPDEEVKKEFEMELSESDLRWEVYNALAYGADTLQYYCYAVPTTFDEDGNVVEYMYDNCILNHDGTPSDVYYSLQKIHKEIQSYASVILNYDWEKTIGVSGTDDQTFRVSSIEEALNENGEFEKLKLDDAKHYVTAQGTLDMIVSHFTSEKYGEAYMFLNWAERNEEDNVLKNVVTATFKDCTQVAVYGGIGFDGTPKIVDLDEDGKTTIELEYGEGVFVTPIKK